MPMHPADQFEAFRALIDNGAGAGDVAARFGVPESLVVKHMKLGRVSLALLAVVREGGMSLEQLQAFAGSDDHAEQERVWADGVVYPGGIRAAPTAGEIPSSDRPVRFVGLQAYQAAGGAVRRDHFDDEDSGYILDPALLQKLLHDKLTQSVASVTAKGWQWVEIRDSFDWQCGLSAENPHLNASSQRAEQGRQRCSVLFAGGVPEGIRTPDLRFRKPLLYPAELPGQAEGVALGARKPVRGAKVKPFPSKR
jgi:hypothetical protein